MMPCLTTTQYAMVRCRPLFFALFLAALLSACNSAPQPAPVLGSWEYQRLDLVAPANEPIVAVHVQLGQAVAAGDLLVSLDPARNQAQQAAAQAEVEFAWQQLLERQQGPRREEIQRVRAELKGMAAQVRTAESELQRQRSLQQRQLGSDSALDQAQLAVDSAAAQRAALSAQLDELLAGTRDEQIAQAQARWHQAQAELERFVVEGQRLQLRAPVAGWVDSLPYHTGELVSAGSLLVSLLDPGQAYARVYLPLSMRQQVQPGAAAQIEFSPMLESEQRLPALAGRLRWVARGAVFTPFYALNRHEQSHLVYLAEIELAAPSRQDLPAGTPVEVVFPALASQP